MDTLMKEDENSSKRHFDRQKDGQNQSDLNQMHHQPILQKNVKSMDDFVSKKRLLLGANVCMIKCVLYRMQVNSREWDQITEYSYVLAILFLIVESGLPLLQCKLG